MLGAGVTRPQISCGHGEAVTNVTVVRSGLALLTQPRRITGVSTYALRFFTASVPHGAVACSEVVNSTFIDK